MIVKIAEYKIKKETQEEILNAIRTFVQAVHKNEPRTFYEAYQKGSSLEFIHLMKFPDIAAEEKHANATYTNDFVKILYPNCEREPIFTDLSQAE